MSTITFDTLKFARRLTDAGVPAAQAEAEAFALSEVLEVNLRDLATRQDLVEMENHFALKLEKELSPIRADLLVVKWMMGALIGLAVANFAKQFF